MRLYHRTYAAETIIRDGFRDCKGDYLALGVSPGVWVVDRPLDERDGALGNVVLVVSGVPESAVAAFEWRRSRQPQPYRQFMVPAALLNCFPIVGIYPDTWLWIGGEFEYVGSLIDMRPLLTRDASDIIEEDRAAPAASELVQAPGG
jgi:hypothetical protein